MRGVGVRGARALVDLAWVHGAGMQGAWALQIWRRAVARLRGVELQLVLRGGGSSASGAVLKSEARDAGAKWCARRIIRRLCCRSCGTENIVSLVPGMHVVLHVGSSGPGLWPGTIVFLRLGWHSPFPCRQGAVAHAAAGGTGFGRTSLAGGSSVVFARCGWLQWLLCVSLSIGLLM